MSRAFVILNPGAGGADPAVIQRKAIEHFHHHGWDCEVYESASQEALHERAAAAAAAGFDVVVAAGGDGTVSAVGTGLAGTGVPLGILPCGTGNVLALDLGIPARLEGALDLLTGSHRVWKIDGMQIEDRLFLLNVSLGLTASMIRDARSEDKGRFGRLAYVWVGLRELRHLGLTRFTIETDGAVTSQLATDVIIANCGALAHPAFRLEPDIELDDGRIHACAVRVRSIVELLHLAWSLLSGRERHDFAVKCYPARRTLSVSAEGPLPVQADGELIGERSVEIRVVPRAVRVIVPRHRVPFRDGEAEQDPC